MNLPSQEEAWKLIDEHISEEHGNIKRHIHKVNKVAMHLAEKLKQNGLNIDLDIVDRASILHDLDKSYEINDGIYHGEKSVEILTGLGYPKLGQIVIQHRIDFLEKAKTIEAKIVNYADARVKGSTVVSLKERFEYILRRYGHKHPEESKVFFSVTYPKYLELEEWIYSHFDEKAEDLAEKLG